MTFPLSLLQSGSHHACLFRLLPVLYELVQLELVIQLPLQVMLKAVLVYSTGPPAVQWFDMRPKVSARGSPVSSIVF